MTMPEIPTDTSCCQGCSLPITDQYILKVLPDMQWHEHCLKCAECSCRLIDTCFVRNSKPYCRQDYTKLFNNTSVPLKHCDKCMLTINRNDLIMKSKEKTFHLECFKCSMCMRKLAPGDEYCHLPENDTLYCKDDALLANSKLMTTGGNGNQLYLATSNTRYLSSTMSITPENSSSSSLCSFSPSTTSSSASSVTDSPSNFNQLNSSFNHSSGTSQSGSYVANMSELGYQNRMTGGSGQYQEFNSYHDKEDTTNNSDSEDDDLIDDSHDDSMTDDEDTSTSFHTDKPVSRPKKGPSSQKSKSKNQTKSYSYSPDSLLMQINNNATNHSYNSHNNKPARIRTVLNEKQLHTLRTCYVANPRPDALMKEQLVEMTGLNPRVIRVWFQNKRCKDKKKNMLRPDQHHHHLTHQMNPMGNPLGASGANGHPFNVGGGQNQSNQHLMFEHCF